MEMYNYTKCQNTTGTLFLFSSMNVSLMLQYATFFKCFFIIFIKYEELLLNDF